MVDQGQERVGRAALLCPLQGLETDVRPPPYPPPLAFAPETDSFTLLRPSLPPPKLATDDDLTPVRWDEWVPEERLKKLTDENILQQKKLVQAQRARDQLEREALAKAEAAEASRQKASGGAPAAGGSGAVPAVAGRREEKRGQKRGRDGEGVSARTVGTGGGEEC